MPTTDFMFNSVQLLIRCLYSLPHFTKLIESSTICKILLFLLLILPNKLDLDFHTITWKALMPKHIKREEILIRKLILNKNININTTWLLNGLQNTFPHFYRATNQQRPVYGVASKNGGQPWSRKCTGTINTGYIM